MFSSILGSAVESRQLLALRARKEAGEERRCVGEEVVGHKKSEAWITKSVRKIYAFTQKNAS
jgi:hypothetical protein